MDTPILTRESETLFIPLLGRADAIRYGDILRDDYAAEIVRRVPYDFSKLRQSRFLSIYMAIRGAILDGYVARFLAANPDGIVLHLGCGLDSRVLRTGRSARLWFDLDLPDVIQVRRQFYLEDAHHKMISSSVTDLSWLDQIPNTGAPALVVAEGLTMYLTDEENKALFQAFQKKFLQTDYLFDAYSCSAVRWSKRKNPVNQMGAVIRWGLDDPAEMEAISPGIRHLETRYFTERQWSGHLSGWTRILFRTLYGNPWANSLYRIYFFHIASE